MWLKPIIYMPMLSAWILLTACQGLGEQYADVQDDPYYQIPLGSLLILKQNLTIPAHKASLYIQDGRIMPLNDIDQYYPHCKFELYDIAETPRTVKPDTFTIYKFEFDEYVTSKAVQYAALGIRGSASTGFVEYGSIMYLRSQQQPNVYSLTCQHWEAPYDAKPVTLRQIRNTLGEIMSVVLKQ